MEIYWVKDKKKCGPASVPDVISLLEMQELTPETKAWHVGCSTWMPLKELPALADFLHEPASADEPSSESTEEVRAEAEEEARAEAAAEAAIAEAEQGHADAAQRCVYLPPPSLRAAAHVVDMSIYATLAMLLLYLCRAPFSLYLLPSHPAFWLPMLLCEAWMLHSRRSTPGMAMFGMTLSCFGPSKELGFGKSLLRSILVFVFGMGFCLFPTSLILPLVSYFLIRHRGISSWDARCATLPVQKQPVPATRILYAVFVVFFSLYFVGYFMQPWMPDILSSLESTNPDMANSMRQWMQNAR